MTNEITLHINGKTYSLEDAMQLYKVAEELDNLFRKANPPTIPCHPFRPGDIAVGPATCGIDGQRVHNDYNTGGTIS